jgi:membrane-associated phospholipid phosphatase
MGSFAAKRSLGTLTRWILLVYTSATAVAVLPAALAQTGQSNFPPRVLAPLHIALIAAILGTLTSRDQKWLVVGDWLPLLAVPLLYAELPTVIAAVGGTYHDAVVQTWEIVLFGTQPSRTLAAALPSPPFSELLHASYLSYYPLIYLPPLALYLAGKQQRFEEAVLAVTLTFVACFAVFIWFPVQGPRYEWPPSALVFPGFFRILALRLLAAASSRGAAFPSCHVAVSVAQSCSVIRWRRGAGAGLFVLTGLLAMGAVYGGFHYAVDVIAGAVVGVTSWALARALARRVAS